MSYQPTSWMRRLLLVICRKDLFEVVEGDLLELYQRDRRELKKWRADLRYFFNVLQFLQPFSMVTSNRFSLFRNHLKAISRTATKKLSFLVITVFGLAISIACTLGLTGYISNELVFDRHFDKSERIYRMTYRFQNDSGYDIHWARMNQDWVNDLPEAFPEIEQLVRFQSFRPRDVKVGEDKYRESRAFSVDPAVFEVFDFQWIEGGASSLLQPYSVVLTRSSAMKYFGSVHVVGKEIELRHETKGEMQRHSITGVIEDPKTQTHLPINLLSSINNPEDRVGWAYTYLLLKEGTGISSLETGIFDYVETRDDDPEGLSFHFQPLESIHLHSNLSREITSNGDVQNIYLFAFIGIFVLVIAVINFANLNVIRSMDQSVSVGIRKILGSTNKQVGGYFYLESFCLSLASAVFGLIIYLFALPWMEKIIGYSLQIDILLLGVVVLFIIVFSTLVSASYPGGIYSMIRPFQALKGQFSLGKTKTGQRVLVGLQFVITLSMLSGILIFNGQYKYLRSKDLGFDPQNLIAIRAIPEEVRSQYEGFKGSLLNVSGIENVTAVLEVLSVPIKDEGVVNIQGVEETFTTDIQVIDINAPEVLGMNIIAGSTIPGSVKNRRELDPGEDFLEYLAGHQRAYLINESAMDLFGWDSPEKALDQMISWSIGQVALASGPVVGVVENFHQESLKEKIDPVVLTYEPIWLNNIIIRTEENTDINVLNRIEETWDQRFPDMPIEMSYVDKDVHALYQQEERQQELIITFTSIGILLTFLGLFALVSYTLENKLQELAIRKVLGARIQDILRLVGKEFAWLAFISIAISVPMIWWLAGEWLTNYAYHLHLSPMVFIYSAVSLLLTVTVTILYQVRKVSASNPSDILRMD